VAVVATVLAALSLWAIYDLAFGIDLRSPAFGEYGGTSAVGPTQVALVSALAALAAWGLMAALEGLIPNARRVWLVIAVLALAVSLGGPLSGTGVTTANRVELVGFHLLVGIVLISLMYRTSPSVSTSSQHRRHSSAGTEQPDTREAAA